MQYKKDAYIKYANIDKKWDFEESPEHSFGVKIKKLKLELPQIVHYDCSKGISKIIFFSKPNNANIKYIIGPQKPTRDGNIS